MKQIAAALFDAMRGCAITPNSVTYGLYTKALAEENSRQVRNNYKCDAPLQYNSILMIYFLIEVYVSQREGSSAHTARGQYHSCIGTSLQL
jgi:hypothetical protein